MLEFLDLSAGFTAMLVRLLVSVLVTWLIIDRLYYKKSRRRDFYFTFMLISIAIFFIVFFMVFVLEDMKGKTSMGIGIGLFGIFSIMRYRTDAMPVREMTYLFIIICLAVQDFSPFWKIHSRRNPAGTGRTPVKALWSAYTRFSS